MHTKAVTVNKEPVRCLFVLSRDYATDKANGRARNINILLDSLGKYVTITLSKAKKGSNHIRVTTALKMLWDAMWYRLPIQTALYSEMFDVDLLMREIREGGYQTVYFDSVRFERYIELVRKHFPSIRIVVDLDDSMAKRYALLKEKRQPFSLGFIEKNLPLFARKAVASNFVSWAIVTWEASAFLRSEQRVVGLSDCSVLYSSADAQWLRDRCPSLPPGEERLMSIHPPVQHLERSPGSCDHEVRFVYIGSDRQNHNKLNIDWLLSVWQRSRIEVPLCIFGEQNRSYNDVLGNVRFMGYVENLDNVYTPNSILIVPTTVAGGVKTKVLEAFEASVAVIGTPLAFEGIPCDCSSLEFPLERLASGEFLRSVAKRVDTMRAISRDIAGQLNQVYSAQHFSQSWARVLVGSSPSAQQLGR